MFCIDPLKEENTKIYESLYLFTNEQTRNQTQRNERNEKQNDKRTKTITKKEKLLPRLENTKSSTKASLSLKEMSQIHKLLKAYSQSTKIKQYNIMISKILGDYVFRANLITLLSTEIGKINTKKDKDDTILFNKTLKVEVTNEGLRDETVSQNNVIELNSSDFTSLQTLMKDLSQIIDPTVVIPLIIFNRADVISRIPYYINNVMKYMNIKYIDCDTYGIPSFRTSNLGLYYCQIYPIHSIDDLQNLNVNNTVLLNLTDVDSTRIKQRLTKIEKDRGNTNIKCKVLTRNSIVFEFTSRNDGSRECNYLYILNKSDDLVMDIDMVQEKYLNLTLKEVGDELLLYSRPLGHRGEKANRYDTILKISNGANIRFDKLTFKLIEKFRNQITRYIKPEKRVKLTKQKINITMIGNKASGKSKFITLLIERMNRTKLINENNITVSTVDSDSFNVWCEINNITLDKLNSDINNYKIPSRDEMRQLLEVNKTGIFERYSNDVLEKYGIYDLKTYYNKNLEVKREMREIYTQYLLSENKINLRQFLSLFTECENRPDITIVQLHNTYEQPAAPRHDVSLLMDNIWNTETAILQRNEKGIRYNLAQLLLHDIYAELTSQLIQKSYPSEITNSINILFN